MNPRRLEIGMLSDKDRLGVPICECSRQPKVILVDVKLTKLRACAESSGLRYDG